MPDEKETEIDNYEYTLYDRVMFGGLGYGTFCLPTNLFRVIFTVIFPPLGVIFKYLTSEFPYVNFHDLFENLNEIIYVFILTAMFYIPRLIYALSTINNDTEIDEALKGGL